MSDFLAGVCYGVAWMAAVVLLDGIARKLIARAQRRRAARMIRPARPKTTDFGAYWMDLG